MKKDVMTASLNILHPFSGLTVAESGQSFGNLDDKYSNDAGKNRSRLLSELGLSDQQFCFMDAQGKDSFIDLGASIASSPRFPTDGLITTRSAFGLGLFPADCVPLVIYCEAPRLLALVHLGWQGCTLNLAQKVIDHISSTYGTSSSELLCYLGPSIHPSQYIVPEIHATQKTEKWAKHVKAHKNNWTVDLASFIKQELQSFGVKPKNIIISPTNTADPASNMFSHYLYRNGKGKLGRNGFVAFLD